jgi:drug/metabolite transporter (DMT)-like permease
MNSLTANQRGALWLLLAAATLAAMSGFSKNLGGMGIHAFQIAFFRSVFGLLALLPFILGKNGAPLSTGRPLLYFLRCGIGITSLMALFYSMTALPLATAAALSFTRPLFLVLLAILFLGESVGWRRGLATMTGFGGVIVLLHPGTGPAQNISIPLDGAAAAVYAAFSMAVVLLLVKKLSKTEHPVTLLFWFTLASTLGTAVPAALVWRDPILLQWSELITVGTLGSLAQYAIFRAYQIGEASVVGPVDNSQMIWAGLIGSLFFGETPDGFTAAGVLIILASTVGVLRWR